MITCYFEDGKKANKTTLRHAVVDMIVTRGDEILLIKRTQKLLEGGKWGLVGGFIEKDETIRAAAVREVLEESGWQVAEDPQLFCLVDNPHRAHDDRQNISLVFVCQALQKVGERDWETDDAQWFPLSDLPPEDQIAFDHADMIERYKQYRTQPHTTPLPLFIPS